jgi:membrane complex biogenesis BtpA family protein
MGYKQLFPSTFPVIGCIHLLPLPGSPRYRGDTAMIIQQAVKEAEILEEEGVNGLIIENFGDAPFFPERVPNVTIASMAIIVDRIRQAVNIPLGVNVLRNDASAALAIAAITKASFIRVNIHMHAMLTDQGIIQGKSYDTLRLKADLKSDVMIWADVDVKHAHPLVKPDIKQWTHDLVDRGLADAIIVTGSGTGKATDMDDLKTVRLASSVPVLIGSGLNAKNVRDCASIADGGIIGSYFKQEGKATNTVDRQRVRELMKMIG